MELSSEKSHLLMINEAKDEAIIWVLGEMRIEKNKMHKYLKFLVDKNESNRTKWKLVLKASY